MINVDNKETGCENVNWIVISAQGSVMRFVIMEIELRLPELLYHLNNHQLCNMGQIATSVISKSVGQFVN